MWLLKIIDFRNYTLTWNMAYSVIVGKKIKVIAFTTNKNQKKETKDENTPQCQQLLYYNEHME